MASHEDYQTADIPGGSDDAPRFFLLHGTGGDEHQFIDLAAELKPGARRIGVRGDVSESGALRYFKRTGEGQYDMADLARATEKLAAFVRRINAAASGGESLGLGYSNGANILASVLFAQPDQFDRSVLMHPLIPFTPPPQPGLKGKRILATAGRNDPIAPAQSAEALAAYFTAQGADVEIFWHDGGHEIRREELLAIQAFLAK
ncbi:alpha/beta hydrolase [Devosia sp.]|uniref:alpha/beta hydrolase n=1 Tax=Devosia sp. TaxID=1871048 RepID=UPI003A94001E